MLLATLCLALPAAVGGPAPEHPNVLIVMCDQLNPRFLGCDEHSRLATPNIERLAGAGVRFSAAYSNAPVCTPARVATFYGAYPTELGVLANDFPLVTERRHLAEYLADAGYATYLCGKSHIEPLSRGVGAFQTSFPLSAGVVTAGSHDSKYGVYLERLLERQPELFPDGPPQRFDRSFYGVDYLATPEQLYGTSNIPAPLYPSVRITAEAIRCVDEAVDAGRPFFLLASYFVPHHPYFPPRPYDARYDPAAVELPPNFTAAATPASLNAPDYTEAQWRSLIAHYSGLVALLDEQVGALVDHLEQRRILDDTLVVFMADHGDMMGEFGALFKGRLEDASARIPLILRFGAATPAGSVVERPVEQVDVFATCLAAAGIELPAGTRGRNLLGEARHGKEFAFCASQSRGGRLAMLVRDERSKLVLEGTRFRDEDLHARLFDLRDDPWELHDLADDVDRSATRERLDTVLRSWWAEQRDLEPPEVTELVERERSSEFAAEVAPGPEAERLRAQRLTGVLAVDLEDLARRQAARLQRVESARAAGAADWAADEGDRSFLRDEVQRMSGPWREQLARAAAEAPQPQAKLVHACLGVLEQWVRLGEPADVLQQVLACPALQATLSAVRDREGLRAFLDLVAARAAATPGSSPQTTAALLEGWERVFAAD